MDDTQTPSISAPRARPRRPGRRPGANTAKTSFKLPPELLEWAVAQPEGMGALIRSLLERERARRVA